MDATNLETNVSEAEANAEVKPEQLTEAVDEVQNKPEVVKYDTHSRVLSESKKWKERAQLAEKKAEELERAELEKQGKIQELWERDKAELSQLRQDVKLKEITAQVTAVAAREGCVDIQALLAVGDKAYLEWDESSNTLSGVEDFVTAAKRDKAYLFKRNQTPVVNTAIPGGNPGATGLKVTADNLGSLTSEQRRAAIAQKLSQ